MPVRITALVVSLLALAAPYAVASEVFHADNLARPRDQKPPATKVASADEPVHAPKMRAPIEASLEAMIGQMILIGFPGTRPEEASTARVIRLIHDGRIGGV